MPFQRPAYQRKEVFSALGQSKNWGIDMFQVPELWKYSKGKGVKIAILDTGATDPAHVDLQGAYVACRNFTSDKPDSFIDRDSHGTAVAGVIGARDNDFGVIGIAPECSLYSAKVLRDDGTGDERFVIDAIDWAIEMGVDIINMSFGTRKQPTKALQEAIRRAYIKNITLFAAAGNCLAEGTRIKTVNGWIPIEKMEKGCWVYSISLPNGGHCLSEVSNITSKVDKVYELKTFTRTISATSNHRFLCASSNNGSYKTQIVDKTREIFHVCDSKQDSFYLEWKELKDITVGDFILIDESLSISTVDIPSLTLDELYFYGIMLGDGTLSLKGTKSHFDVSTPINSPHTDYLIKLGNKVFDKEFSQSKSQISLYKIDTCRKWGELFPNLMNKNSHTKRIENWVFDLPLEKRLAVVQGYLDSDGTVHQGNLSFECVNKNLIEDFYELCIKSGIKVTNISSRTRVTNFGLITTFGFKITNFSDIHKISSRHPLKKEKLKKFSSKEGERKYKYKINDIVCFDGLKFDRVQSIEEDGEARVFDLEVPINHNFIANNIVVHNCGENGNIDTIDWPAKYPEVISVGAINRDQLRSTFSSVGQRIDLLAPGEDIITTSLNNDYATFSGTSFACPFAVGVAALCIASHRVFPSKTPCETPTQVREHLLKTAIDVGAPGWDKEGGFGIIHPVSVLDTESLAKSEVVGDFRVSNRVVPELQYIKARKKVDPIRVAQLTMNFTVETFDGEQKGLPGDFLAVDGKGAVFIITKEEFEKYYETV